MCLTILNDQINNGLLEHLLIFKIITKKYPNLFANLLNLDQSKDMRIDEQLWKAYIKFLGTCR